MKHHFFHLMQVAIGKRDSLNEILTPEKWRELHEMAKKQSLVGVCLYAIQRLGGNTQEGWKKIGIDQLFYVSWMGQAALIERRNRETDRLCLELQQRLKEDGFSCYILKGQGIAHLYNTGNGSTLGTFRQSGDIDVLMWKEGLTEQENRKTVIEYAKKIDPAAKPSEHHISVRCFPKTEVELHYIPAYLCNPWANRHLQNWCLHHRREPHGLQDPEGSMEIYTPPMEYNAIFMLAHAFRHYMSEGVGLRQMMDYYFVLTNMKWGYDLSILHGELKRMNLLKFASAVMWVLQEVFDIDEKYMICKPCERLGQNLLNHIMRGGNFGHHNKNTVMSKDTHLGKFVNQLTNDLQLAIHYPGEAIWSPLSMIREFIRIRI